MRHPTDAPTGKLLGSGITLDEHMAPCPACNGDGCDRFGDRCPLGCADRYVDAPSAPAPCRSYALDEDPFPLTGVAAP